MELNRRNFLLGSAAAGFLVGCASAKSGGDVGAVRIRKAGEKPTLAMIGCGIQGRALLHQFLGQDIVVKAVCDVNDERAAYFKNVVESYYKSRPALKIPAACQVESDFRKIIEDPGIDMVCVATPDHWHAYITIEAMKHGKDVYCEKPLTYNVEESRLVMEAAKKYGRIVQCGAMQRSGNEFRTACEIVRNGFIGKVRYVDANYGQGTNAKLLGGPSQPHRFFSNIENAAAEGAPNPHVNWNMWLGPAPYTPYSDQLCPRGGEPKFYPMFWRFDDYFGTGYNGDWGAHHLDIAQWGLNMDQSGPVKVLCSEAPHSKNPIHGCRRQQDMKFVFADGTILQHRPFCSSWGTIFYGTEGIVAVGRSTFAVWQGKGVEPTDKIRAALVNGSFDGLKRVAFWLNPGKNPNKESYPFKACDKSLLAAVNKGAKHFELKKAPVKLYKSLNHVADFCSSFLSRKAPCSPAETGARAAILCQLCNMSYVYDTGFEWDPVANTFANGTGDKHWLTRDYCRDGWKISL